MDDDDETWLSGPITSTPNGNSASKGTSTDLDAWLSTTKSSIDFATRSALSRKLKGYAEKKARRRQLRSASTISLESVCEESPQKNNSESGETEETPDKKTDDLRNLTITPIPLYASSPLERSTVVRRSIDNSRLYRSMEGEMLPYTCDDEELRRLEEAALGLSLQEEGEGEVREEEERGEEEVDGRLDCTQEEEDEFFDAPSDFEDDASSGRSRELESLDEEPARTARQQMLGARLGMPARSSSVSPRMATTTGAAAAAAAGAAAPSSIHPSPPRATAHRMERVAAELMNTPVGRGGGEGKPSGGMSVSLHIPSSHHLPPRRIPPGREIKDQSGKKEKGKEEEKKVNLHENLAKIRDLAREQEEALRREVMGSLSANDVSNGENESRLITSKSIEFAPKKEFHSRLPTPSRRVIPIRTPRTGTLPIRASPVAVGSGCATGGGSASVQKSRSINGEKNDLPDDECF